MIGKASFSRPIKSKTQLFLRGREAGPALSPLRPKIPRLSGRVDSTTEASVVQLARFTTGRSILTLGKADEDRVLDDDDAYHLFFLGLSTVALWFSKRNRRRSRSSNSELLGGVGMGRDDGVDFQEDIVAAVKFRALLGIQGLLLPELGDLSIEFQETLELRFP